MIRITPRLISIVYYMSMSLCFIVPLIFFTSWNNISYSINDTEPLPLHTFHIDVCDLSSKSAYVSGWAVIDGVVNSRIRIFMLSDDRKIELFTSMQRRPDVSSYLKSPGTYDRSGFYASKKSLTNHSISKNILISLTDTNGKSYEAKYECM